MTTDDIEVYRPRTELGGRAGTDDWYDPFPKIIKLAEYVAGTEFVPDTMRNRPAAIAAAILTGREMGLPPMVALRHLYIVRGRVGQSAELMRALIYREGHEIRYVEATETRCIIEGRRKGEQDWTRVQFTVEDARKNSIDIRGFAADKLVARATSRLARRKFADVVMGLPVVDELEDAAAPAEVVELAPAAPLKRSRATRKPAAANTQPKPPPASQEPVEVDEWADDDEPEAARKQPAPSGVFGESEGERYYAESAPKRKRGRPTKAEAEAKRIAIDKQLAKERAEVEAALPAATAAVEAQIRNEEPGREKVLEPEPRLSREQLNRIQAQFRDLGYGDQQHSHDRHTIISHILDSPCDDTGSLTRNEAIRVIDRLMNWYFDNEPDIHTRIREILNEAALREAHEAEIADLEKRAQEAETEP